MPIKIHIPAQELFDEEKSEFIQIKDTTLVLEHSLISVSKWESKWKKPFLDRKPKTIEEQIDYVRCMTMSSNVDPNTYYLLSKDDIDRINAYIDDPMTATWFSKSNSKPSHEIVTAEVIYFLMISYNVPVEFEKWHLNRLLTLLKVCELKNTPSKKMSKREIMNRNRALNARRRHALHSRG